MSQLVKLDAKHLETLLKHKHFYDLFIRTGELVGFTHEIQNDLLNVYRLADPIYTYNSRCGACVGTFLVNVYNTFNEQLHS
jgi:hypothetical protein